MTNLPGTLLPGTLLDPTLEALCAALPPEDALALREERAAILEHQAGFTCQESERRAGLVNEHPAGPRPP